VTPAAPTASQQQQHTITLGGLQWEEQNSSSDISTLTATGRARGNWQEEQNRLD
jgi:hypothetical protein